MISIKKTLIFDYTLVRLWATSLFALFSLFLFLQNVRSGLKNSPGYDFKLRYHEVECLHKGIDPYDIVTKQIPSTEFALFGTPEAKIGVKTLHVYTPWEYTYFLPFSYLPEKIGGMVFMCLSTMALTAVGVFSYRLGEGVRGNWIDGIFVASSAIFLGNAAGEVLAVANYGAFNALLILLLALALSFKHDLLAGVIWALLMTKPQIGLLFAIPFLLRRRYITICVAIAICIICTIPPWIMCGHNPLELILEVPRGCAFVANDNGTMIIPSSVFKSLDGKIPLGILSGISMTIGAGICFYLTWRLRKHESWFVFLAPTVVCAILWNYCKPHDRVILWLLQALLAITAIQTQKNGLRIFCFLMLPLIAWPFVYDMSVCSKMMRRISLASLLYYCWMLPKLHILEKHVKDELLSSCQRASSTFSKLLILEENVKEDS